MQKDVAIWDPIGNVDGPTVGNLDPLEIPRVIRPLVDGKVHPVLGTYDFTNRLGARLEHARHTTKSIGFLDPIQLLLQSPLDLVRIREFRNRRNCLIDCSAICLFRVVPSKHPIVGERSVGLLRRLS